MIGVEGVGMDPEGPGGLMGFAYKVKECGLHTVVTTASRISLGG